MIINLVNNIAVKWSLTKVKYVNVDKIYFIHRTKCHKNANFSS